LAIAGGSVAFSQPRSGREGGQRWQPSIEDMRAFGEARLAALKAGLALTPEQERNWPAFEQAARELGRLRLERMQARRDAPPTTDRLERLRQRGTAMADQGAALRKLAEAADPLYKSLDDNQKRRFEMLSRFVGPGRHHFRGRHDGYREHDDDDDEYRGHHRDGPRHHWRRGDERGTSGRDQL
jgi:hypothetical protein